MPTIETTGGVEGGPRRGPGRPRSTATPDAIRRAAAALFAERGFSATSLRDIASMAGSDPAVVIRQFGSKEKLFLEVLTLPDGFQGLVEGPLDTLGREIVRRLLEADDAALRLYGTLLGALDRSDVRLYLEQSTTRDITEPLAARLSGPDAELRAQLVAAQIGGLLTHLSLFESTADRVGSTKAFDYYATAIQALIDEPTSRPSRARTPKRAVEKKRKQ
jgi:AcrR family transcriptional regulator